MFKKLLFLILCKYQVQSLVVPEDVATGFGAVFGFVPKLMKGNDHRFGFGFSFGNHADFQILYEFGPQTVTKLAQPHKARSTHSRFVRRYPILEFLLRAGILKKSYKHEVTDFDEPR